MADNTSSESYNQMSEHKATQEPNEHTKMHQMMHFKMFKSSKGTTESLREQ